eukprot:2856512-Rhodomonas_salina.1
MLSREAFSGRARGGWGTRRRRRVDALGGRREGAREQVATQRLKPGRGRCAREKSLVSGLTLVPGYPGTAAVTRAEVLLLLVPSLLSESRSKHSGLQYPCTGTPNPALLKRSSKNEATQTQGATRQPCPGTRGSRGNPTILAYNSDTRAL